MKKRYIHALSTYMQYIYRKETEQEHKEIKTMFLQVIGYEKNNCSKWS